MLEREKIIAELWRRLAAVNGVRFTARNPKVEPSVDNMPCIQFFELDDEVQESSQRGGFPAYKRALQVAVESFIKASTDAAATKELGDFIIGIKKALYSDGISLGHLCQISEIRASQILRPPVGENVIGIGIIFELRYVETVSNLFP